MSDFKFVTLEHLHELLEKWEKNKKNSERKQYLAFDIFTRTFLAVDNRTQDFFIEEFKTHDEAVKWLLED